MEISNLTLNDGHVDMETGPCLVSSTVCVTLIARSAVMYKSSSAGN